MLGSFFTTPKIDGWVDFVNDASETVPAFGVVQISGISTSDTSRGQRLFSLTAIQPDETDDSIAINGPMPVPAGSTGRCTFRNIFQAYYDGDPTEGDMLGKIDSQWYLSAESERTGFRFWGASGTSNDNNVGVFERVSLLNYVGVTTEEISAADWSGTPITLGSGDIKLYRLTISDPMPSPLELEEVHASNTETWYNVVPATIAKNKIVQAKWILGKPVIDVESCVAVSVIP